MACLTSSAYRSLYGLRIGQIWAMCLHNFLAISFIILIYQIDTRECYFGIALADYGTNSSSISNPLYRDKTTERIAISHG